MSERSLSLYGHETPQEQEENDRLFPWRVRRRKASERRESRRLAAKQNPLWQAEFEDRMARAHRRLRARLDRLPDATKSMIVMGLPIRVRGLL